jgi:ABC-2 type transport system ATP-binding protein
VPAAIVVTDLRKSYGRTEAVRGVSFEVAEGEVFGLLGPNGAGKTTTVEILEGYRPRDGGSASVLGLDPGDGPRELRERIGVVLELVGLGEKRDARVKALSGGQKRRLDLGVALVGNPDLVFLDEPTTGFDPAARRAAWDLVRSLRSLGTTILLTTHYLDEAQQLADRVAVLRGGVIVREGSPAELIGDSRLTEIRYRMDGEPVVLETDDPTRALHDLTTRALREGFELEGLEVRRPTLEDVYLELVGEEHEGRE